MEVLYPGQNFLDDIFFCLEQIGLDDICLDDIFFFLRRTTSQTRVVCLHANHYTNDGIMDVFQTNVHPGKYLTAKFCPG
jgi:hypothetical protein